MTQQRFGFWAVAFAFLIVMAFATMPSPLYGLYRTRDGLSAFMVTVVFAIFAVGTIGALLSVRFIARRAGRRGAMFGADQIDRRRPANIDRIPQARDAVARRSHRSV